MKGVAMKSSPALLPDLYLTEGIVFGTGRRVIQYRVEGLLDREDVSIAEFGGRWRIFRTKNGVEGALARSYATAEDAFTALRYEVV